MSHPFGMSKPLFDYLPTMRRPQGPAPRRTPVPRPVQFSADEDRYHPWPLNCGINVVLFSGAGGACQGLEWAGFPVHVAVNHDRIAIAAHRALNPHTRHLQADITEVDPLEATGGRYVNNLWLSPDCSIASQRAVSRGLRVFVLCRGKDADGRACCARINAAQKPFTLRTSGRSGGGDR